MMETKHTPTPWGASHGTGPTMQSYSQPSAIHGTADNRLKIVAGCFGDIGGPDVAAANAEFIARACNAHEQLVAALQYAKHRLELADEDRFDKTTLQQINDALKVAGAT